MWCVLLVIIGSIARQTDWMGGPKAHGPVDNWGTQYWISDSVTVATPGQVSPIATGWDYSNWVRHEIERSPYISWLAQGLLPADINGDGIIEFVAHSGDKVVWYENTGNYNFVKHVIGPTDFVSSYAVCVYPVDLEPDGDVDVLVATPGVGLGWYENRLPEEWVWHDLDRTTGYHRVSAANVDLDEDIDIIAVDNSGGHDYQMCGDIYLFRNQNMMFNKELIAYLPDLQGWRVYPTDFNADGYPDIYSVFYRAYIFLNTTTGHFDQVWHQRYWSTADFDGAWPSDIDMDGDMDLVVCGQYNDPYALYALINQGTGRHFDRVLLRGTEGHGENYGDGGMACDVDLDGHPDIVGSNYKVGYFRHDPSNPLTFKLYRIENSPTGERSHWIYACPTRNVCIPAVDLLVTWGGAHMLYENRMLLGFARLGYLESSILTLTPPDQQLCNLLHFGYIACVPNDTALAFYWRAGVDSFDIVTNQWNGPYYATVGVNVIDSFAMVWGSVCVFQYKAEFRGTSDEVPVLYEVWMTYECSGVGVEEVSSENPRLSKLQFVDRKLILHLPLEDNIEFIIYDVTGRQVRNVFSGYLPSGTYEFETPLKSGIYFARLISKEGVQSLKFIKR